MKEYSRKYRDWLTVIGIACKDKEKPWLRAVEQYGLDWINVIDNPQAGVSVKFGIEAYPTKIILDRGYNIVEIFIGEGDPFYVALDRLMGENQSGGF